MRRSIAVVISAAIFLALGSAARASSIAEIRVLSSTQDWLKVEVGVPEPTVRPSLDHPGYHVISLGSLANRGERGEPSLPKVSFWIALPPGATATVTAEAVGDQTWDGIRPLPVPREEWTGPKGSAGDSLLTNHQSFIESPAIYAGGTFPAQIATVGTERSARYQRIAPILLSPARWNPASGTLTIARKVEITVTFHAAGMAARRTVPERQVGRDDPSWERTYQGMIVNYDQARGWGRMTALPPPMHRFTANAGPLVKLEVKTSGIRRVTFEDLPDTSAWRDVPVTDLRLYEIFNDPNDVRPDSTVDVPIQVIDADGSQTWTRGDALYFYGQNLYERRPDLPWYIKRYGRLETYWLGVRSGQVNLRMQPAGSFIQSDSLPKVTSYPWTEHFEQEEYTYMKPGAGTTSGFPPHVIDDKYNLQAGVASVRSKHFYWKGGQAFSAYVQPGHSDTTIVFNWYVEDFDLPGYRTGSAALRLTAKFQGFLPTGSSSHMEYLSLTPSSDNPGGYFQRLSLPRMPFVLSSMDSSRYVASGADLVGMPLRESGNHFSHLELSPNYGATLDWLEVQYVREPRFVQPSADPSTWVPVQISTVDLTGPKDFLINTPRNRPFTDSNGQPVDTFLGFDATDPLAPKILTIDPATQIQRLSMRMQWNCDGTDHRYLIAAASSVPRPERIAASPGNDLLAPGDQDYVVVIPRAWISAIQPLVDHRAAQGHRVLIAPIEDIYDQFSGGRHWPHAVRSFLRALFRTRTTAPAFLLLAGDASDVFDNPLTDQDMGGPLSKPNWVPTQTMFSGSYAMGIGPELVASDQWFVDNLSGTGENMNFAPDMHVGRLPVNNPQELAGVVNKILAYETFSPDDIWRNRALFVSDDQWSSSTGDYKYMGDAGERIFEDAGRAAINLIRDGGQCDFGAQPFFVSAYMDTAHTMSAYCRSFHDDHGNPLYGPPNRCAQQDTSGHCVLFNQSDDESNNRCYGGTIVRDQLVSELSRGYLFVSYVGHSNPRLITHEYILVDAAHLRNDVDLIGNAGKPYLFMGYGCHLNEFSSYSEALPSQGDCMTEDMLLRSSTGAIASLASPAYEWVSTSDDYSMRVMQALFTSPPQFEGHTRWVLGEIVSKSKQDLTSTGYAGDYSQSLTYCLLGDPGLVMDGAPPRIQVTVDGTSMRNGDPLVLPADRDSILIEGTVCDEIWAKSLRIQDANGEGRVDTTHASGGPGSDRAFLLRYHTTVYPRDYDLTLTADDGNGRTSVMTFTARVDRQFEIKKPGQDWTRLDSGELVLPDDSLRVRITLPRYVQAGDIDVLLDGQAAPRRESGIDMSGNRARQWILTYLESVPLDQGVSLGIRIRQPDGAPPYEPPPLATGNAVFQITGLYNVPNPFGKDTWVFYGLGIQVDEATLKIFTSSGKLIRTFHLETRHSLTNPPLHWDGTDEDGDPVANGLYFYKITARAFGKTVSRIEKMARVR